MKFELDGLDSYDQDSLKDELRRVASLIIDKPMTRSEFDKMAKVHSGTIVRRFGTWENALREAGLLSRYSGRAVSERMRLQPAKGISNAELINDLRRVVDILGSRTLSRAQFDKLGHVSSSAIERRFGSWKDGLKAAGILLTAHGRRHSADDYFENLLSVWTHLGRQPTNSEMDLPPSRITAGAYEAKFGSWRKALRSFVDNMNAGEGVVVRKQMDVVHANPSLIAAAGRTHGLLRVRTIPIGLRYKVLSRDSFRCVLCGSSPATVANCRLHVDHIVPWSNGGKSEIDNLRTLCEICNLGRGNRE